MNRERISTPDRVVLGTFQPWKVSTRMHLAMIRNRKSERLRLSCCLPCACVLLACAAQISRHDAWKRREGGTRSISCATHPGVGTIPRGQYGMGVMCYVCCAVDPRPALRLSTCGAMARRIRASCTRGRWSAEACRPPACQCSEYPLAIITITER